MPNFGAVLKEEISRLARKELRSQTRGMKKASSQYRRDIAALKRQVTELQRQVSLLETQVLKSAPALPAADTAKGARFTAKGLHSQRERLGLSAADYAKLVGVSSQSIYNWERGETRPRKEQVAILAGLRGIGKREARARLAQLNKQGTKKRRKF